MVHRIGGIWFTLPSPIPAFPALIFVAAVGMRARTVGVPPTRTGMALELRPGIGLGQEVDPSRLLPGLVQHPRPLP